MEEKKKSRYKDTKGEMEINRAFKMQEKELADLKEDGEKLSSSIISVR